jgi:hypothetical protein
MATISTGVKALNKIQLGKESAAGTAVAATTIWRGMGKVEDGQEVKRVAESIGIAMPTNRFYVPKLGASITFDPVEATFQQFPYILEAGVAAETPTQDGTGSGYIYAYAMPTTTMNTINTYTIEGGDNVEVEEMEYGFVESFKISGNAAEGVMMEAAWVGRQVSDATFTGALSVPALVPGDHILFGGSKLYIDAVGGTIGSTEVSNSLLSFELDVTTGLKAKYTNAEKYFDFIYWDVGSFSATLKLVFEHNTASEAQKDLFKAGTPRQFRLEFLGNAVADNTGATHDNLKLLIDAAGTYTAMENSDVDGNNTKEATVEIAYDPTAALGLEFLVVNELSALP